MAVKEILKKLIGAVAPGYLTHRVNDHQRRFEEELGLPKLQIRYLESNSLTVLRGPFEGMRYIAEATGSMYVPKLVGSYEEELYALFAEVIAARPPVVVDIGCAEGYYAIGMARALPEASVYAFDMDERARTLCAQLAQTNQVEKRLKIENEATPEALQKILQKNAFILCDCEGCESFILEPSACPALKHCDIMIELHDHIVPETTEKLKRSFSETHQWITINQSTRRPEDYPELSVFSPEDALKLVTEYRPATQSWVFLRYQR